MKKIQLTTKISAVVLSTLFLFSCSTSNKLSKRSFGGGWEEAVATKTVESPAVKIESNVAETNTQAESEINATATENKVRIESTQVATAHSHVAAQPSKVKTGLKTKLAQKIIAKQAQKIAQQSNNNNEVDNKVLLVILAILLPWLAVLLYKGVGTEFWISLLLWFLFVLPGIIYALLVVLDVI